ncbi:hypothetical protein SAMN02745823_00444 [Sporobacter termitidis DSM 10068]|uniref:DUF5940 domain-containing protein n=1 Tax=Sporobacter termitidis DSM 10068 TaxID=1123282 RepID=A0A1M5UC94_9FIRM|nr:hypothetical protein SAMN02745823_00444 [Sporobacter termitidis DSM 10068]
MKLKSVIKGAGYILVHTPDMVLTSGTTQTTERTVNPDSPYLAELPGHIRSYEKVLEYYPNQVYIGNVTPGEFEAVPSPWHDKACPVTSRHGKFGEIMPQEEFLLLMQACDVFDLIKLEAGFVAAVKPALASDPVVSEDILARIPTGTPAEEIKRLVDEEHAEGLLHLGKLVGCMKRAHDIDVNLSAHVMLENIVSKASSVLALLHAVKNTGIGKAEIEYVIDCAEEACGDMNQRGGGSLAKSAAEIAGLTRATGSDCRGFCAGPAHAIVEAAALVTAGVYTAVAVTAGGCTAKLGMNGKDHIKKGLPVLEDMLGGFTVIISADDGVSPEINLDIVGRHTVGTGSSPQAVISSLVTEPLEKSGMKILDIDKFAPELQNPDITKPAGAGDVPLSNYKMIGALAAKRGEITPKDLDSFVKEHGLMGWAPTQGHIPSGVPYLGFAREDIISGKIKNAMVIGKGSLFLGRMTNLFDGVSFVVQKNSGVAQAALDEGAVKKLIAEALRGFAQSMLSEE